MEKLKLDDVFDYLEFENESKKSIFITESTERFDSKDPVFLVTNYKKQKYRKEFDEDEFKRVEMFFAKFQQAWIRKMLASANALLEEQELEIVECDLLELAEHIKQARNTRTSECTKLAETIKNIKHIYLTEYIKEIILKVVVTEITHLDPTEQKKMVNAVREAEHTELVECIRLAKTAKNDENIDYLARYIKEIIFKDTNKVEDAELAIYKKLARAIKNLKYIELAEYIKESLCKVIGIDFKDTTEKILTTAQESKAYKKLSQLFQEYLPFENKDVEQSLFLFYKYYREEVKRFNFIHKEGADKHSQFWQDIKASIKVTKDVIEIRLEVKDGVLDKITLVKSGKQKNRDIPKGVIFEMIEWKIMESEIGYRLKDEGDESYKQSYSKGYCFDKLKEIIIVTMEKYIPPKNYRAGKKRTSYKIEFGKKLTPIYKYLIDKKILEKAPIKKGRGIFSPSEFIIEFLNIENLDSRTLDSYLGRKRN